MDDDIKAMKAHIELLERMIKDFKGTIDKLVTSDAHNAFMLAVARKDLDKTKKENLMLQAKLAKFEDADGREDENRRLSFE